MTNTLYINTGTGVSDSLSAQLTKIKKDLTKQLAEEALEEYKQRFPQYDPNHPQYDSAYDINAVGGVWDAFRHTYAAARVGAILQEILEIYGIPPEEAADLAAAIAEDLGAVREGELNDPNNVSDETKMDLVNNEVGAEISKDLDNPTADEIADAILEKMTDDQGNLDPTSDIITSTTDPRLDNVANDYDVQSVDALTDAIQAAFDAIDNDGFNIGNILVMLGKALLNNGLDAVAQGLEDLGDWLVAFWEATGEAAWMGSPLVLDLDGDGIELISLENSTVIWDIDEDGFAEHTGWAASDDGMLAIDLNGDGIVTDHTELFGSITEDGFTALSVYDTNTDGVIDANDTQFGDLLVWQDVNENAISEAGELYTLADLDIVSIDLNASTPYEMYIEGHNISHVSSYTVDDGVNSPQILEIVDAWFQYDNRNTEYIDDYTLDLASLLVSTVRGYGSLPDLHVSASIDNDTSDPNSLMSLLQDFNALDFEGLFVDDRSIMDQTRDIMFRWAGADTVDPTSMGQWADAQELTFINALRGEQWLWFGSDPNPWSASSEGLQKAFEIALYAITSKLVAQAGGAALFNDEAYYNPATDTFEGFTAFNQDALDDLLAKSLDGTQVASKTEYWAQVVNMVDNSVGVSNLTTVEYNVLEATIQASDSTLTIVDLQDKIAKNIEDQLSWTPDGDYILGTTNADTYDGTVGDDFYDGGSGDDVLSGGLGNDLLYGGSGNDTLDGQLGNDELRGNNGDDTYKYFLGHGDDTILEQGGNDRILFGQGISINDLNFIRVGAYDLTVEIDRNVGYGSITIQGHFSGGVVETIEFNNGSTLDLNSLDYTYVGTSANETIYGVRTDLGGSGVDTLYGNGGDDVIYGTGVNGYSYTANNTIYGGDGNDTIYADGAGDYLDGGADNDVINGGVGIDTLIGGTGDDTLKGNRGNDTYIFNYGDGNDIIYDTRNNDTILMGAGIDASMISATRLNINDLMLEIDGGAGGTITLQYHTYGAGNVIETMQFSDGSTLDLSSFDLTLYGTSANDLLYGVKYGGSGIDTIYGYEGNDIIYGYRGSADIEDNFIYGGAGNDNIFGAHGVDLIYGDDGNDTIQAYNGNDTVYGGAGDDILRGSNQDDLLYGGDGADQLFGDNHNDTLIGGLGLDQLTGGGGSDTFVFLAASSFDAVDVIKDFSTTYDAIDISDILSAYDPLTDAITDFVQITDDGTDSTLFVDVDGGADNFVAIALIDNRIGLTDEQALETSGNLIAV